MNEREDSKLSPGTRGKMLLYAVDDEQMLLELVTMILESDAYEIQTFCNPLQALEAFRSAEPRPELIIADYAMPSMNGMKLLSECRAIQPGQKVLLVSGTIEESLFEQAEHKPDAFLAKPYTPRQLIGSVEKLTGR